MLTAASLCFILNACISLPISPRLDDSKSVPITQTIEAQEGVIAHTLTPTPLPLGHIDNPLIMALVLPEENTPLAELDALAAELSQLSSHAIQVEVYTETTALLADMENGLIHLAWLLPAAYVLAHQEGYADVLFVANHYGVDLYGVQFMANQNSSFTSYYDPETGRSTAGADVALAQFQGKRPCWVSIDSLSGYAVPVGLLQQNEITTPAPTFLQDPSALIRALHTEGICDFGATFSVIGDPRTSPNVLTDLPDALQQVPIIWRSDAIIPMLNLSILPDLPPSLQTALVSAVQTFLTEEGSPSKLSAALNYNIQDLKRVNDAFYSPFREVLSASGLDLHEFTAE